MALTEGAVKALGYKPTREASSTDSNIPMSLGVPALTIGATHEDNARQLTGVVDVLLAVVVRHAAHPVQVGAGAKRLAFGGQHDAAHGRVMARLLERLPNFPDQGFIECVAHIGARQRDGVHAVFGTGFQMIHGITS